MAIFVGYTALVAIRVPVRVPYGTRPGFIPVRVPVRDEMACCVKKIGLYNHRRNDLRTSTRIERRIELFQTLV